MPRWGGGRTRCGGQERNRFKREGGLFNLVKCITSSKNRERNRLELQFALTSCPEQGNKQTSRTFISKELEKWQAEASKPFQTSSSWINYSGLVHNIEANWSVTAMINNKVYHLSNLVVKK